MSDAGGTRLDRIARELASGEVSRRSALRRLGGAALAAAVPGALLTEPALGRRRRRCPDSRKCGDKCCPRHSKCKHGRCKCNEGYTKCGKKCVDLETSGQHCGDCEIVCADGETCIGGTCTPNQTCGNEQIEGTEECDGNDLGGASCQDLGFVSGTLACANDCTYDTSGCVPAGDCEPGAQRSCYSGPQGTAGVGICQAGTQTCTAEGTWGSCAGEVLPQQELCDGLDNDCDGVVDEDFPGLGGGCLCDGETQGIIVCSANGLGVECQCT